MTLTRSRAGVLALVLTWAAIIGGCGEGDPVPAADLAAGEPEAEGQAAPAERSEPRRPERLRLLKGGHPTVYPRVGAKVDLYDQPGGKVVQTVGHETEFNSRTVFAVTSQRRGWASASTPFTENGEPLWLELDPKRLRAGRTSWEIEVDLSDYRADLFLKGKRVRSFAVSIGMPGAPTPTGRFAVTDTFRGDLNPAYGCCAVALTARQTNLPSGWLGGDRIAIHGTSGPLNAAVSHGCVRTADEDVSDLVDKVPPGTPVTIRQ